MFTWLKKCFIPHEGNNHRPHVLRNPNIRIIVLIILFFETATFFVPTLNYVNMIDSGNMAAVLPAVLSTFTNEERETQKLPTLAINPLLTKAAELKASDMASKGYFAHTSPEGKTPWYWIDQVGYNYQYAGENLAINFTDSKDVTNAWMASPTHRANILKGKYTEIGTGIATGIYQGNQTIFVAQIYASPAKPVIVPTKKITQSSISKKEISIIPNTQKLPSVLGAETENTVSVQEPTFLQKIFISPHDTTSKILIVIFGIILIALLLNVFIKIKHHHPDLVTNGLLVLVIILAILIANNYVSKHNNMVILKSIDYTNGQI